MDSLNESVWLRLLSIVGRKKNQITFDMTNDMEDTLPLT